MRKTVEPFTGQLITYQTNLPFGVVISRLNEQVNKTGSANFLAHLAAATTKEQVVTMVANIIGSRDFLWMNILDGPDIYPPAVVYTIGNPVIAETFMRYDIGAGYAIPPQVMVLGDANDESTTVFYHRPSSLIISRDPELMQAVMALDEKLDYMITNVTADN
ncbi:hypothetical protein C0995_005011 [Termitomyces sp. Mi166|nr:hypothetical protein C0995_005011 [Termitomyces sp. Mi166\